MQDEQWLVERYGHDGVELAHFRHYLLGHETLLSLHECQPIHHLSKGLPSVLAVLRTPFQPAHAFLIQLKPKAAKDSEEGSEDGGQLEEGGGGKRNGSLPHKGSVDKSMDSLGGPEPIKQFEFPPGVLKPQCKL